MKISNPFKRWVSSEERCTLGINLYRRPTDPEHFLPIATIPSWGEFSHQDKDRTQKNALQKSCLPFQNVSIFQVLEQVPKPIGIRILFPKAFFFQKKIRLTSVALFVFIQKKNSPSNSKALFAFQKTPKPPPRNHALHLSHPRVFRLAVLSLGDKRLSRFGPP